MASSAATVNSVRCTSSVISFTLGIVDRARASPKAATASSTVPYASTRVSVFGTRPPYSRPVSPRSPYFVYSFGTMPSS